MSLLGIFMDDATTQPLENLGELKKDDTKTIPAFLGYTGAHKARVSAIESNSADLAVEGAFPQELEPGKGKPINIIWSPKKGSEKQEKQGGLKIVGEEIKEIVYGS